MCAIVNGARAYRIWVAFIIRAMRLLLRQTIRAMRVIRPSVALAICLALPAFGPASRPASASTLAIADRVLVKKSERRMYLLRAERVIASYRISLGLNPDGPKEREGDFRTPEGEYRLGRRNSHSDYFLSIQVTYPNDRDAERARARGWRTGGSIMIHGLPNTRRHPSSHYQSFDWTDGCIALSNADMIDMWLLTTGDIPIAIEP
jgi:murein L,D-transpeptidase YafK